MAKRRAKPPENPLSADLIAAAVAPVQQQPQSFNHSLKRESGGASDSSESEAKERSSTETRAVGEGPAPRPATQASLLPRPSSTKQKTVRVRMPEIECEQNAEVVKTLRTLMGEAGEESKVTESDVMRALWSLARQAEEVMEEIALKAPKIQRPSNGDWVAKAEYDDSIARFLHLAIKRLGVKN